MESNIEFARCVVTGEFAPCVSVHLGDLAVAVPDRTTLRIERATSVEKFGTNPLTGEGARQDLLLGADHDGYTAVIDDKEEIIEAQATLSLDGLEILKQRLLSADFSLTLPSPELVYKWCVLFADGSALSHFERESGESDTEIERKWQEVMDRWGEVSQVSLLPRYDMELPTYTVVRDTNKFYRNGQELDVNYPGEVRADALLHQCRQVTQTLSSSVQEGGLSRKLSPSSSSVVYCLGWKCGMIDDKECPACMVGIDRHGNWRLVECR